MSTQPKKTSKNIENHGTIWGKLCIAVQGYTLNHCTKFAPNPTRTKVNTDELTSEHPALENIKNKASIVRFGVNLVELFRDTP